MPKMTDTYVLAYACCETILKELSRFPTIDLIRERIGVNSPNTIKKAMNDWTEAFAKQYIEQQHSALDCPGVPSVLTGALTQLWQTTVAEAQLNYAEQAAALQTELDQLQHTVDQQQDVLTAADQALTQAGLKQDALSAHIASLTAEQVNLQAELRTAQQREHDLSKALEQQQQRETDLLEQQQHRLEQEQAWMQRRILEERELAAAKAQDKQLQLEERLTFLKAGYEQSIQAQRAVQRQNQQLLTENAQLNTQLEKLTSPAVPAHRFQRQRAKR
ncbi:MAG: DNA-binding protein [Methylobacter sp.]|nr:DNA-binding protein [Methylobacter sp.]MDP3363911.1 DNA-binding protein [Methylobacter sp.]MDZ4219048.1 DNA-binding protein [Methylobacter sp.]